MSLTKGDQHIDPCHKRLTYLVCEHNASDALWIPEQLVHIIVTNDHDHVLTAQTFHQRTHSLITNEAVKG